MQSCQVRLASTTGSSSPEGRVCGSLSSGKGSVEPFPDWSGAQWYLGRVERALKLSLPMGLGVMGPIRSSTSSTITLSFLLIGDNTLDSSSSASLGLEDFVYLPRHPIPRSHGDPNFHPWTKVPFSLKLIILQNIKKQPAG
ncbi:hypothetical protein CRG98_023664 [Punica granatum]|uniref:Uncharacterized protein n=1 Tax=Punica granatum TaxID=22663 RepID=A0A2I0JI55_PUNGR|nr:hypothetical protein CRG98_023664 [Punica granatum]